MNRKIILVLGVSGLLSGPMSECAQASVPLAMSSRNGVDVYFDVRPDFIWLDDYGFAVSYGSPYDVVYYGDDYYLYDNGRWYRSRTYRGPWGRVRSRELPPPIRRHDWRDIRRRRDNEYRRYDRGFWDNRFRMEREQWRRRDGEMRRDERQERQERREQDNRRPDRIPSDEGRRDRY